MSTEPEHTRDPVIRWLGEEINVIKATLGKISDAMTTLALVEERQTASAHASERAFNAIEKVQIRVANIEMQLPLLVEKAQRSTSAIEKALWAVAGLVAMYVAKKVGLVP